MFFTFFVFIFTFFQFTARVYLQWNSVSKKSKFPNNYISSYFLSNNPFLTKKVIFATGGCGWGGTSIVGFVVFTTLLYLRRIPQGVQHRLQHFGTLLKMSIFSIFLWMVGIDRSKGKKQKIKIDFFRNFYFLGVFFNFEIF